MGVAGSANAFHSRVSQGLHTLRELPLQGPEAEEGPGPCFCAMYYLMSWKYHQMQVAGPRHFLGRQGWRAQPLGDFRGLSNPASQSCWTEEHT